MGLEKSTQEGLPQREDKITKDHNNHTHVMTVKYPNSHVKQMKAGWRQQVKNNGKWLEEYNTRLEEQLKSGYAAIDEEVNKAKAVVEAEIAIDDEELFKIYKQKHLDFIAEKQQFIKDVDKRKAEFKQELSKESEKIKKHVYEETKKWTKALKLWNIK